MQSEREKQLRYFKDRFSNAYWMLRDRKFGLFVKSLALEANFRLENMRKWIDNYTGVGNQPRLGFDPHAGPEGELVELPDLDSEYIDRRRVVPPSYRPTKSRRTPPQAMQADPNVLKDELRSILSSLQVRERG